MAVNPKQKRELSDMWNSAEEAGGSGVPDGTYQMKIVGGAFKMTGSGKPCFKTTLEIVGGNDELLGETIEINDNLETKENMGWFKTKLLRLNVSVGDMTFDDIENGTLAEQLNGKVFEGQAKTKGGFLNVYVNRLIGEDSGDGREDRPAAKHEPEDGDDSDGKKLSEGDKVEWNGKTGEVVEVLEDEGLVRVKKADGQIVRVKQDALSLADDGGDGEDGEDGDDEDGELELPGSEDVEEMSAKEVKEVLGKLKLDASEIKNPRGALRAFCALAEDPKAKIEMTDMAPLIDALGLQVKKGANLKDTLKLVSDKVQEFLG